MIGKTNIKSPLSVEASLENVRSVTRRHTPALVLDKVGRVCMWHAATRLGAESASIDQAATHACPSKCPSARRGRRSARCISEKAQLPEKERERTTARSPLSLFLSPSATIRNGEELLARSRSPYSEP